MVNKQSSGLTKAQIKEVFGTECDAYFSRPVRESHKLIANAMGVKPESIYRTNTRFRDGATIPYVMAYRNGASVNGTLRIIIDKLNQFKSVTVYGPNLDEAHRCAKLIGTLKRMVENNECDLEISKVGGYITAGRGAIYPVRIIAHSEVVFKPRQNKNRQSAEQAAQTSDAETAQ